MSGRNPDPYNLSLLIAIGRQPRRSNNFPEFKFLFSVRVWFVAVVQEIPHTDVIRIGRVGKKENKNKF